MIGIIVAGHGQFASGLTSAAKLLMGEVPIHAIDFSGDRVDLLEQQFTRALEDLSPCDSILILCDLAGGTPFRTAVTLTNERKNVRVLYGVNLNLLLELCMDFNDPQPSDLETLVRQLVDLGKEQVGAFGAS